MKLPVLSFAIASGMVYFPAAHATADLASAVDTLSRLHTEDVLTADLESDASDRIHLANRLTMLTQMAAASSCALASEVAVEESHANLEEAMYEMDLILDALRYGDDRLHILGPEPSRRVVHDLDLLAEEWRKTHDAVESMLRDGHDPESAHVIDDHNLILLEEATVVASDIMGRHSHPFEITQANAVLITVAGRQRMLTQKMAKDACEIWSGYHDENGRADLEETMVIFENSFNALLNGMPALGIQPAPTETIREDLEDILARWEVLRGNLDLLLAGEELDMDQKYEVIHDFDVELGNIEHLVHDYNAFVKTGLNAMH